MSDKDGMAKNWEVVKREVENYRIQVAVVMDRVRRTEGLARKIHVLSGLGPDIHRIMPRSLWYGGFVLGALALLWFILPF